MNTPYKFREVYGSNAYVLENELPLPGAEPDEAPALVFCGWQNEFHPDTNICDFDLSLFEEQEDGSYLRSDEHQQERCYSMEEIQTALRSTGMELLGVWSDLNFSPISDDTERWYFAARAVKPNIPTDLRKDL